MKKNTVKVQIILSIVLVALSNNIWAANSSLNDKQKLGYALGMDIGASLRRLNPPIEITMLLKGLSDLYLGNKNLVLTPDEAYRIKKSYASKPKERAVPKNYRKNKNISEWRRETAKKNIAQGRRFLMGNKLNIGVKETISGLQYMIIKKGTGQIPDIHSIVSIRYKAMNIDGNVFDDSSQRAIPVILPIKKVLKGWQESLTMMSVGSFYRIFLPAELTYGGNGSGTYVEPGATLIFEIELLGIVSEDDYLKSESIKHKIPPYTSRDQSGIILPKAAPKQSVVNNVDVDLKTLESAGETFMTLRNNIMPVYKVSNVQEICGIISNKKFYPKCVSLLMERVDWLKGLVGLKGAEFPTGKIEAAPKQPNTLKITWKEVLFFNNNSSQTKEYNLKVYYEMEKNEWLISKIEELL